MSLLSSMTFRDITRIVLAALLLVTFTWQSYRLATTSNPTFVSAFSNRQCSPISSLDDVLVIVRTGATEASQKMPIHFETTLRDVPHYVVYSDYEEDISGHKVFDALRTIPNTIKRSNTDFTIYNRLQKQGKLAFEPSELAHWSSIANTKTGMQDNPAWKLDKWKFLPLLDRALEHRPQAKWFVFVEADTLILWHNLVDWLAQYNSCEPYHLGSQDAIGDVIFGHGGSGFAISNSAMYLATTQRKMKMEEYDDFTAGHWAGDCVLGKLMFDAGVPLTYSYPVIQGAPVSAADYGEAWCQRAVSFHHMSPEEIKAFWELEKKEKVPLRRHKDVFKRFVKPQLNGVRDGWDNLSDDVPTDTSSAITLNACREACLKQDSCLQFSFSRNRCRISSSPKLGHKGEGQGRYSMQSGWIVDRIQNWEQNKEKCDPHDEWV